MAAGITDHIWTERKLIEAIKGIMLLDDRSADVYADWTDAVDTRARHLTSVGIPESNQGAFHHPPIIAAHFFRALPSHSRLTVRRKDRSRSRLGAVIFHRS